MRATTRSILAFVVAMPCLARAGEPVWEPIATDGAATALVELDRTRIDYLDNQLTGWLRLTYAEPAQGRIQQFRSAVALYAFDCDGLRYAMIGVTTYSEPLGEGDVIDRWDSAPAHWQWRTARHGTSEQRMLALACSKELATIPSRPMHMSRQ